MLKRLEADGLVERGEQKEAILTPEGAERAQARRAQAPDHRALPHRLHGLHGRRVARPCGRARRHVHRRDDRADQRAARAAPTGALTAGRSTRSSSRRRTPSSSRSRSSRSAGKSAEIVRLAEHDGDLLHWFYDEGLVPGSQVAVASAQPAAGQLDDRRRRRRARDHRARRRRHLRPRRLDPLYESLNASLVADHTPCQHAPAGHRGRRKENWETMRLESICGRRARRRRRMLLVGGGTALAAFGRRRSRRSLRRAARQGRREARRLGRAAAGRHQGDACSPASTRREKAGRISTERAAKLRERVAAGELCGARKHAKVTVRSRTG